MDYNPYYKHYLARSYNKKIKNKNLDICQKETWKTPTIQLFPTQDI